MQQKLRFRKQRPDYKLWPFAPIRAFSVECTGPHYRDQADHSRRLAREQTHHETKALLERASRDYDDIAEDLENGAVEIRHPEMLPQRDR
jgi:hypothetical protein